MSIKTYAMAVRDTIAAEMRRDEKVFIMGEDIETIGSIFGCTRDLTAEFGRERAFNTPISEAGFIGAGLGAAAALHPAGGGTGTVVGISAASGGEI